MWTDPETKGVKLCGRIGKGPEVPAVRRSSLRDILPCSNPALLSHCLPSILSSYVRDILKAAILNHEEELRCVSLSPVGLPGKRGPGELPGQCGSTSSEA